MKERTTRISIKAALDHPWFVGADADITKMRQQADKDGNDTLKFISYSHHDAGKAKETQGNMSPKARINANTFE